MLKKTNQILFLLIGNIFFLQFVTCAQPDSRLTIGADRLIAENVTELNRKRIALIVNHTSLLTNGTHLVDTLARLKEIEIKKLFSPEHGIRGNEDAGKYIMDGFDPVTGIKVISLYGSVRKPTSEMLNDVDIIIFDIQDVGSRYYTYISTLYYAIEAAAEQDKQIIVLDRPNPINGKDVEGPVLESGFRSFVGIAELPIRHGMTVGELALLFNDEIHSLLSVRANLKIIKLKNWDRQQYFDNYFHDWIPPSPNINTLEAAIVYPGTCLIEGTNLSEGRGTLLPFLQIGAPFLEPEKIIYELNKYEKKGFHLESALFKPIPITGMSLNPKLEDAECHGIRITVTDRTLFKPTEFIIKLLSIIYKLYPDKLSFNSGFFDKLAGTDNIRQKLLLETDAESIIKSWQKQIKQFKIKRNKYLLY